MRCLFLLIFTFVAKDLFALSPLDLRKSIFAGSLETNSCKVVSRGIRSDLKNYDPDVERRVQYIKSTLKERDTAKFTGMFHPRLKIGAKQAKRIFGQFDYVYREPELSVYRVWALNAATDDMKPLPCPEDALALQPHYGYPLQFGVWIQVMGQKELARIYLSLVPRKGQWLVGFFHLQQWTHLGKDAEVWVADALEESSQKRKFAAFAKLDIAQKLLRGGGYVYQKLRLDVETTKQAYYADDAWHQTIVKNLLPHKVVYTGTLLAKDGAGVLVRLQLPKKVPGAQLKPECLAIGKKIHKLADGALLGGVRCGYTLKGESPTRDGSMGSRFIPRAMIAAQKL